MVLARTNGRGHVLIISHDVVGPQMAGPGIRYTHLARILAQEFDVVLAIPAESTLGFAEGFQVLTYRSGDEAGLQQAIQQARVVLIPAVYLANVPALVQSPVPLVIDGYDPFLAETLFLRRETDHLQCILMQAYLAGDFFICASERQRDWWLGLLEASGRVNPRTFGENSSLRQLVDVVPFGMPKEPPQASRSMLKGVWPGIGPEDKVILWGGGLWPWLDPLTAIRALATVWRCRQDVRLIFPGTRHPNPQVAGIPTHNEVALHMARDLGLLDRAILFGEWVPYADWPNVLLESDVALTLHEDTLETRLAFRSRVLDYMWAGVPVVATRGDATCDLIARYETGVVVDYHDVDGVAEAILRLLDMPRAAFGERFDRARQELTWEHAARPLLDFCRHPRRAPDKTTPFLGHPYYQSKLLDLETEVARLGKLVAGYERGRFIRFMRHLRAWPSRVRGDK